MGKIIGILRKLKSDYKNPIEYYARVGDQTIPLNPVIGHCITLSYTGHIYCIQCGRETAKSFQQGFCFPCLRRLQECDLCIVHPERCHIESGSCSPEDWAHSQCGVPHIVYLANTSGLKVGITRESQVPTRWIDQGASQAMPLFRTQNRYQVGMLEVLLKRHVSDRTDWRVMLKNEPAPLDLRSAGEELYQIIRSEAETLMARWEVGQIQRIEAPVVSLTYPVVQYPHKINLFSFDSQQTVQGQLVGIKGQYLILDTGVINVRKFSGYEIELGV